MRQDTTARIESTIITKPFHWRRHWCARESCFFCLPHKVLCQWTMQKHSCRIINSSMYREKKGLGDKIVVIAATKSSVFTLSRRKSLKVGDFATFPLTRLFKSRLNRGDFDFFLVPLRSKTIGDHMIWIVHVSEKGNWLTAGLNYFLLLPLSVHKIMIYFFHPVQSFWYSFEKGRKGFKTNKKRVQASKLNETGGMASRVTNGWTNYESFFPFTVYFWWAYLCLPSCKWEVETCTFRLLFTVEARCSWCALEQGI